MTILHLEKHRSIKSFEPPQSAVAKWNRDIHAKDDGDAINIYSTIGDYGDGTGMTAKIVSSVLRKANGSVRVNINSAGGDFFEGVAIYNMLREYEGDVKVKIVGLAASAASIIAMAADELEIAESGFMMIHNAWTIAIGNKDDMEEVAAMLGKFDDSMAKLYADFSGQDVKSIKKMMAAETWLSGKEAVEMGLATALLESDEITGDKEKMPEAMKKLDAILASRGVPRSERRALIKEMGKPRAAEEDTKPCASELTEALTGLLSTLAKGKNNDRRSGAG
jgi:ATP-dependent protease ClpP protease subunit